MRPLPLLASAALVLAGCVLPDGGEAPTYYRDILAGAPFTDLVVEIDHAPGREPSRLAVEHLLDELRNVTSKTRIGLRTEQTLRDDVSARWSSEALIALERETRTATHAPPTAVLHILYPAGEFENASVAGITISGCCIGPVVVFLDTIDEVGSPLGPVPLPPEARDEIERATLLHEVGHAMGLVDNGLPMVRPREDPEHEGHSRNEQSVMFWRVESLDGIRESLLHDGVIPIHFDADDRADMQAAGGR